MSDPEKVANTVDAPVGRACEMERISREGKCGKPASGFWIHDDGTKTAVCDMCAISVMVNGGKLEEAANPSFSRGQPEKSDE